MHPHRIDRYKYEARHRVKELDLPSPSSSRAKNIILMIGDGMGTSQIYAGLIANKGELYIEQLPFSGFVKTHASDQFITDSAAGATAMATGQKTNAGTIGLNAFNQPIPNILEMAEKKGLSTGLVATSTITHATPAAFIAHSFSRHYYEQIASFFLETDIEVFIGGGRMNFTERLDRMDLTVNLKEKNYTLIDTLSNLEEAQGDKIAGLIYHEDPPGIMQGRGEMLGIATNKALEILSRNDDGFFLMVEGSQIDWGNHQNNILYQTEEMLDFDRVIGSVLEFAAQDGETLVIITSDHETGGLAIADGIINKGIVYGDYTTSGHTAVMVPVFAYGPSAELFGGIMDNTDIFFKMLEAYDWEK